MFQSADSSNIFKDMFNNATIGIFQTTPEGRYIRVNSALAKMYGYKNSDEMLVNLTDINQQLYTNIKRRHEFITELTQHGSINNFEAEIRRADGTNLWISEDARIVHDKNDQPLYFEGFVRDISERKQLEIQLSTLAANLEQRVEQRTKELVLENQRRKITESSLQVALKKANAAMEAKGQFLANVTHELRTPMNAIIGFSEIINQEIFGPVGQKEYLEYSGHILSSSRHLLDLINEILDISKIEAGSMELHYAEFHLQDVIFDCMNMMQVKADEKNICLDQIESNNTLILKGDVLRVKQILLNLFSNAIKFTPEGGHVSIQNDLCSGGIVKVKISDNGIGIPPEQIQKVFEEYAQTGTPQNQNTDIGTGLGLPISKNLALLHGGDLELESELGKGTTAILTLPHAALA